MSQSSSSVPTCYRHPDRVSYIRCQRCERYVCPECQRPAPVGVQCVECVAAGRTEVKNRLGFTAQFGTPVLTYAIIGINVALYLLGPTLFGSYWRQNMAIWPKLPDGFPTGQIIGDDWWRWISSGFAHADLTHLLLNMFVLWQFGSQIENLVGRLNYALIYGVGLLGSSALVSLLGEYGQYHLGASGAIFGVIAAYLIALIRLRLPYQSLLMTAGLWLVLGLFMDAISWQGHLGGALGGAAMMLVLLHRVEQKNASHRRSPQQR